MIPCQVWWPHKLNERLQPWRCCCCCWIKAGFIVGKPAAQAQKNRSFALPWFWPPGYCQHNPRCQDPSAYQKTHVSYILKGTPLVSWSWTFCPVTLLYSQLALKIAESVPFAAADPAFKKWQHHSTNEHSRWKGFMIHTPAALQAGIVHFANGESIVNRRLD